LSCEVQRQGAVITHVAKEEAAARVRQNTGSPRKPATDELQLLVIPYNPMFTSIYNPLSNSNNSIKGNSGLAPLIWSVGPLPSHSWAYACGTPGRSWHLSPPAQTACPRAGSRGTVAGNPPRTPKSPPHGAAPAIEQGLATRRAVVEPRA
jgi:hypothetical protein